MTLRGFMAPDAHDGTCKYCGETIAWHQRKLDGVWEPLDAGNLSRHRCADNARAVSDFDTPLPSDADFAFQNLDFIDILAQPQCSTCKGKRMIETATGDWSILQLVPCPACNAEPEEAPADIGSMFKGL